MEDIVLISFCLMALYHLSLRQDRLAEKLIAESFDRFERRYDQVTYSCLEAKVIKKQIHRFPTLALVPSIHYTAKALCLTEDNHWFWFDATVHMLKVTSTTITPSSEKEASDALRDDPGALKRHFPKRP